jgi:hypothetical protein
MFGKSNSRGVCVITASFETFAAKSFQSRVLATEACEPARSWDSDDRQKAYSQTNFHIFELVRRFEQSAATFCASDGNRVGKADLIPFL